MNNWLFLLVLLMHSAAALLAADAEPVKKISITSNTSWMLRVNKEGAGKIFYGSDIEDGASFDKGTIAPSFIWERFKDKLLEKQGKEFYGTMDVVFENGSTRTYFISDKEGISDIMLIAAKKADWDGGKDIMAFIKEYPFVRDNKTP